ncbi:unnamed protein product [Coregonus sp. 'balchen']|nr:unnamed protein product [Coregonus sp. 'balchen']
MNEISLEELNGSHHDSTSQLNMQGVFLHILVDALGSVIIVESALILLQTVPKQINMHRLLGRVRSLDGVLAVHDLQI